MRILPPLTVALAILLGPGSAVAQEPPVPEQLKELIEQAKARAAAQAAKSGSGAKPAAKPGDAKKPKPKPRPRVVFGKVVDGDDRPIAGVGVTLGSVDSLRTVDCLDAPLARTDAEGRFEFLLPPPPEAPPVPKPPAAPPAKIGPSPREPSKKEREAVAKLAAKLAAQIESWDYAKELAADRAIEEAKRKIEARKEEIARRKFLLACAPDSVALRVTMPTVDHKAVKTWREPKNEREKQVLVGVDLLARVWGRARQPKRDGVDLGKLTLLRGDTVSGKVIDDAGKPVAGARIAARDLLTSGKFQGVSRASNNKRALFYSYATTAKDGSYRLPGVFETGSQITAKAKGYYELEQPFAGAGTFDVRLTRCAAAAGKVVDPEGRPATAGLSVLYEASSVTQSVKVGKDGTFEFHPRFPQRFRLVAAPSGNAAKTCAKTYSEVLDAPRRGLLIELDRKKAKAKKKPKRKKRPTRWAREAKLGFPVSVTDAATGRPLREFEAAAVWVRRDYRVDESYFERRFKSTKKSKSKQPGYVRLPGPPTPSTPQGGVVVKAKGYATFVHSDIEFEPGEMKPVDAALVPESILGGTVRDETDSKPIRGAKVRLYQMLEKGGTRSSGAATSDASGRFEFKGLGAGRYRVRVSHGRRTAKSVTVELAAEEKRADLEIPLVRGVRLTGRVVGVKPGKDWKVELLNESVTRYVYYNPGYRPSGRKVPLSKDGSFEFPAAVPGYFEICLNIPRGDRQGRAIQIPIEPIRIRKRDRHVVVDASEDRPTNLAGKITMTGTKLPMSRLLVVVQPFVQMPPYYYYSNSRNINVAGAHSRVAADGTFDVTVATGKQRIKIFDVVTGVQLYQNRIPIMVESDKPAKEAIELALTEVTVKLKPATEGGKVGGAWLNIDVEQPKPQAMAMFVFWGGSTYKKPVGVSLVGRTGDIELVLPPYKTKFQVYSNVARLSRAKDKPLNTLGDVEITPKLGEKNEVEIEVKVPTTGFDPRPKGEEDDLDGELGDGEGPKKRAAKVKAFQVEIPKK